MIPAPGHTPGSIALLTDVEGTHYALVGDMIEAPGRAPLIRTLQYTYTSASGAALLTHSLRHLLEHKPHVFLPGRGPVIERPIDACDELIERLRQLCREMWMPAKHIRAAIGCIWRGPRPLHPRYSCGRQFERPAPGLNRTRADLVRGDAAMNSENRSDFCK